MTDFNYVLYGYEVDEYCEILINKYGLKSDVVQCLDNSYDRLRKSSHIYAEQLNAIRHFLNGKNFKSEIAYADAIFTSAIENKFRQTSKYSGLTDLEVRRKAKEKSGYNAKLNRS